MTNDLTNDVPEADEAPEGVDTPVDLDVAAPEAADDADTPAEDVVTDAGAEDAPAEDAAADDAPADAPADAAADDAPADDLDDLLGMAGATADEPAADEPAGDADAPATDEVEAPAADEAAAEEPVEAAPAVRPRPKLIEDVRDKRDLSRLFGDWFVVHTYAGYEQRVKDNLANRVESLDAHDRVYEVVIPTEEVTEFKKGKKQTSQKKFLPGYVLVRMEMDDETWNIVRHTPAVTGFVGATGSKPVPLSLSEVADTLKIPDRVEEESDDAATQEQDDARAAVAEIDLEVGETIRVTSGPFADFTATIAEINLDQARLRVLVSVFGRETPLTLKFENVAKL